jgi:hypothetical protein
LPRLYLEQFLQDDYDRSLFTEMVRQVEDAVNRLSEGRIYQNYNASASVPSGTTVAYQIGDKVWNTIPRWCGVDVHHHRLDLRSRRLSGDLERDAGFNWELSEAFSPSPFSSCTRRI